MSISADGMIRANDIGWQVQLHTHDISDSDDCSNPAHVPTEHIYQLSFGDCLQARVKEWSGTRLGKDFPGCEKFGCISDKVVELFGQECVYLSTG